MNERNEKFVRSMLESAKKKNGPMPPEKIRELTEEEEKKVDNFIDNLKRGVIK